MAVTVSSPVWRRGRNNLRDQERKENLTERNYLSEIDFLFNQPVRSESPSYLDSRQLSPSLVPDPLLCLLHPIYLDGD